MRLVYCGIFLLAGSIVLLEIALTRVFAIMMWHHLTYLVISIALLGFGASGSMLTALGAGRGDRVSPGVLAAFAGGYGVTVVGAFLVATQLPVDTLHLTRDPLNFVRIATLYVVIFVPFLLGGFCIGLALSRLSASIDRLYFADLVGSAAGGGLSVLLLARYGSSATVLFAATAGVGAACLFAAAHGRRSLAASLVALVGCGAVAIGFAGGAPALGLPAIDWHVPFAPGKVITTFEEQHGELEITRLASPIAEVEVVEPLQVMPVLGGDFGQLDNAPLMGRPVTQDGTAPTLLYEGAGQLERFAFLDDSQAGSGYVAGRAAGVTAPEVLVIGVGGGIDVMIALAHGARRVTAVEINPAMIHMVTNVFDDYIAGLFRPGAHPYSDRIELVLADGRAFARHGAERYDLIQLSGVDSFTALSTGAYTLSESYLYTTEAVRDLYARLADGGIINYSRFIAQSPRPPRESLRLANNAYTALREAGAADPASQILVFRGRTWASTMIKRGAFQPAEVAALREFASREGFWGLVFDPTADGDGFEPSPEADWRMAQRARRLLGRTRGISGESLEAGAEASVAALHEVRSGALRRARRAIEAFAATLPAGAAPGVADRLLRAVTQVAASAAEAEAAFQQSRGLFTRMLRGDEAARRAFVADYEFDVTPTTDDSPFFFNYYKTSALIERLFGSDRPEGQREMAFPVGHTVLAASLLQIGALAALFILLPLRFLPHDGRAGRERWRVFLYFAALGAGFMFIEIALMQKMVLFLGHPTFAISVVLTSLLGFSGVGALLSGRVARVDASALRRVLAAIVCVVAIEIAAVATLLPAALGLPIVARVALVVALLAPLGLCLGMPFPLGIRILAARHAELIPWGWAINGFVSVLSSILCIVLAMATSFTFVLFIAIAIYAIGHIAMLPVTRAPARSR